MSENNHIKLFFIILVLGVFIVTGHFLLRKSLPQKETLSNISTDSPSVLLKPSMQNKTYHAVLKTSLGTITIELFSEKTPITASNFISLAKKHFYDGTIFHRVIKGFMIQGGDPNGDGTGGPGYSFDDEPFEGSYMRGIVAMANAGPNTNGSQFFIMHADYPLPHKYVIFGKIINGMEVVDAIATAPVQASVSGEISKPKNPVVIESVIIEE